MQVILCNINLFDADQKVWLVDESSGQKEIARVPLDHLYKVLPDLCRDKNVYNVHLFGFTDIVNEVTQNLAKEEVRLYNENKIKVEVN